MAGARWTWYKVVASALVADMYEPTLAVAGALIVFPANWSATDCLHEVCRLAKVSCSLARLPADWIPV